MQEHVLLEEKYKVCSLEEKRIKAEGNGERVFLF
jgi:hypothetical protein